MRTLHSLALSAGIALGALVIGTHPGATQQANKLLETAKTMFQPIPDRVSQVRGEKVTQAQIDLGKLLFFDPRLSRSHIISCNSCHNVGMGGGDNVPTSIGHKWERGPRNSPTVLNAVFNAAQFWDGRAKDLREQAKGPVQAAVEMNNTPNRVELTLRSIPAYVEMFKKAFPGQSEPVTFDNMARAIEAFEITLVTPNSRFDQFLRGKLDALNATEQQGLSLFMEKGCAACHNGVNMGGQDYFPFGVFQKPGANVLPASDRGRFVVTNTSADEYVFRAAPLRNVALTAPYFHSGQVWSLKEAVTLMGSSQLGQELNEKEVDAIVAFLQTLTGEQPKVEYPILPASTASTPQPE